jgi:uncharacterized protein YdcH (DUF465 family)
MSHTAKNPTPEIPEIPGLNPDKEELISEYKQLDAKLAAINNNIQAQNDTIKDAQETATVAQQNIANLRNQGLQFVGEARVISRILKTMGVNTEEFTTPPPMMSQPPETPPPTPDMFPPEEVEETPAPKRGLKNRFSPR